MSPKKLVAVVLFFLASACGSPKGPSKGAEEKAPATSESIQPKVDESPKGKISDTDKSGGMVIQVFVEDSDRGVPADVSRMDASGALQFVANVGDSGVTTLQNPCSPADRFSVEPKTAAYLKVDPQGCASTITFHLTTAAAAEEMIRLAQNDEAVGNFASAQNRYSIAAEKFRISRPEESAKYQVLAAKNAGKVLGIHQPTETKNGKESVKTETKDAVKAYQLKSNLPPTGVLDPKTSSAILKMKSMQHQ